MRTSTRARPLPPDERRAALIAATLPLLRANGMSVTTRQLAEASGVAEGTIFRVFPDKDALIQAAIGAATDPDPILLALDEIDLALPLRERMLALITILQAWLRDIISLMISIRTHPGAPADERSRLDEKSRYDNSSRIDAAILRLLAPDQAAFRLAPADVVRVLRALVFAGAHPMLAQGGVLTPQEIVDVVLDGTLVRTAPC